ncbi:MAG: sigma-54-dependent Fis family transcriptional regulator [Planctomycetaceae bacterium]|nr:sigma-54-dependent Fis family transcriptional regulator [Planctomycetaceae bacterium]
MITSPPATIRPTGRVLACARDVKAQEHLLNAIRRNGYEAQAVSTLSELQDALVHGEYAAAVIDEPESTQAIENLEAAVRRADRATQFIILPSIGQRMLPPRSVSCEIVDPPLTPERIGRSLFAAVGRAQLIAENIQLKQRLEGRMFDGLVGVSDATRKLRNDIQTVAEHNQPVLIHGEPGSGKSEVARAVHLTRSGPGLPFLAVRCGLLTAGAVEHELYGDAETPGRLSSAAGGTLVFEDVDLLAAPLQQELASIIFNNAFKHGGSYAPLEARIVATSCADLAKLVAEGKFDRRLYEVLAKTSIGIRPLRDRMEDLPVLTEYFLQQCAVREGQPIRRLTEDALDRLRNHPWTGNVREVENVISRCCSIAATSELVNAADLEPWLEATENDAEDPGLTLREMERKLIEATFNRFGGNRELTAKALKIGIRTLSGKLREYGYPPRGGPGSNRQKKVA